jgi:type IV pilus assembly protein PilY1
MGLLTQPSESADFATYCQYPPYVYQSKLPSVMLLVSNSYSMSGFAYQDNTADTELSASGGFVPGHRYYGLFDPDYWYNASWVKTATKTTSAKPAATSWHGSFLNWLTMRRIDVVNKLLTGGMDVGSNSSGYQSCGNDNTLFKKYVDDGIYSGSGQSGKTIFAQFTHKSSCTGKNTSGLSLYYWQGATKKAVGSYSVVGDPPTGDGLIQRNLPKAQIGLAFYNEKGDGANITVPVKSAWGSSDWNKLKTPSQYNNEADQPLADALFSISGYFAQVANTNTLVNTTTLGGCTSSTPCGPDYGGSGFATRSTSSDPYYQHGGLSQCTKGNVIILTDGEPCSDGNLPTGLAHYADTTLFHCDGTTCAADTAGIFSASAGPPACISRSGVSQVGREKGTIEDVALWAHTTDLRTDIPNTSSGKQALDIWIVRAFGFSQSNILKYAAINGSFDTATDNVPRVGNFDPDQGYFESDDPYRINSALDNIFQQLLKRATSGTAASVLASGEGSGANLVQAVFYPQRIFVDDVIGWTGTLQNFWYYIDPFFGNSSIREDSDQNAILNLQTDNTIAFYFDSVAQVTKASSYANDNTGKATGLPSDVLFEKVKSLWEAGKFLHAQDPDSRTIFTVTDATPHVPKGIGDGTDFTVGNKSYFKSYLGVADSSVDGVINYARGIDDNTLRPRTVQYPTTATSDNTVWKLGDIINSTPRVVASIPLNTYNKVYNDFTYKTFIDNTTYKNRGMVFTGANDGMLHAFKLGKLTFPGDNSWTSPAKLDRARLENIGAGGLGSERWAFIPRNALPYLQALPDNNYCHLYYVDLAPQVFDASIAGAGDNDAMRNESHWATILIGGMRFGGACRDNTATCTDCVKSPVSDGGFSSYFAIDVTDPESPSVLWEFTDPALGFATTGPAIVRINAGNPLTKGNWYAVFGSGPTGPISSRQFLGRSDQNLKLFIVDLKTGNLVRTIDTGILKAFAGSMVNSSADFNLDYTDDALYIGYVKENSGTWNKGGVLRLQTKGSVSPNDWVASKVIDDIGPVTSSVVRLQNNNSHINWLFFGSGRYYYSFTDDQDDPTAPQRLYGIKEPCFGIGGSTTISPSCTDTVLESALTNVDTTYPAEAVANAPGFKGWFIPLDISSTAIAYDNTGTQSYQAERVITDPLATTAGIVYFTTLRPYNASCAIGGRTFLWATRYNTGGVPSPVALQGKALMQVSTASVEQLDLGTAFSNSVPGADASLHRGGRRSYAMEGVPPTAQGLSLLVPPPPVKRTLHMKER